MAKKVVLAGGGVLGVQIGLMSAYTGHDTTFWLRSEGSIGRTQPKIDHYEEAILADIEGARKLIGNPMAGYLYPRGLFAGPADLTEEKIEEALARAKKNFAELIHIELDMGKAFADADFVIEAMSEDLSAKEELFRKMQAYLPEKTILLTNSSTLLPSVMAPFTGRPDRFCAMHFANSIWRQNTAEIMGEPETSPFVYQAAVDFAKELNMIPLELKKEQPGYMLNSLLIPFLNAAGMLLGKGVSDPETIDRTWKLGTGAPKGPFEIFDIVGLDTAYNICRMQPEAQQEGTPLNIFVGILKEKIDKGEKGINSGKGFYDYSQKK